MEKNLILVLIFLFVSCYGFAQSIIKENKKDGSYVTYFREDGTIEQEGSFYEKVLDGRWIYYDRSGDVNMIGYYDKGVKTGTWLFKIDDKLKEVIYDDNKIVKVNIWKESEQQSLVNN